MRKFLTVFVVAFASPVFAEGPDINAIVNTHILPHYETLAHESAELAAKAQEDCAPERPSLRAAYGEAFDAWIGVSHLRFGPSEHQNRAFALSFWPDPRSSTPKALSALIADKDDIVSTPEGFSAVSVAAKGFYALEFLLYEPQFSETKDQGYLCALIRAATGDIATNAAAIQKEWAEDYAPLITSPGNDTYRDADEANRQLFTSLLNGLEFTAEVRLGRPMGTFDRPRPKRAEAWRSGRSLRHVILSLVSMKELAVLISKGDAEVVTAFDNAIERAETLDDPVLAGVSEPQGRLRVEVLQHDINDIRTLLTEHIGPRFGIEAGFNSMDGD